MHTYRRIGDEEWSIGYWKNEELWAEVSRTNSEMTAVCRVNMLNGGNGEIYWKGHLSHEPAKEW